MMVLAQLVIAMLLHMLLSWWPGTAITMFEWLVLWLIVYNGMTAKDIQHKLKGWS